MEIEHLSSGPMIVLCLARENVVDHWKRLMGPESCLMAKKSAPTSLRAIYGDADDDVKNAVYGSDNVDDVQHELQFFFPNSKQRNVKMAFNIHFSRRNIFPFPVVQEPILTDDRIRDYLDCVIHQPLNDALYEMTKVKPDDPLEWLAMFMLKNNNNKPTIMGEAMEFSELKSEQKVENDKSPAKCGCYLSGTSSSSSQASNFY
jgi:nucleoside diphosphate kinase homolog 5